jgi:hypothetical protein
LAIGGYRKGQGDADAVEEAAFCGMWWPLFLLVAGAVYSGLWFTGIFERLGKANYEKAKAKRERRARVEELVKQVEAEPVSDLDDFDRRLAERLRARVGA